MHCWTHDLCYPEVGECIQRATIFGLDLQSCALVRVSSLQWLVCFFHVESLSCIFEFLVHFQELVDSGKFLRIFPYKEDEIFCLYFPCFVLGLFHGSLHLVYGCRTWVSFCSGLRFRRRSIFFFGVLYFWIRIVPCLRCNPARFLPSIRRFLDLVLSRLRTHTSWDALPREGWQRAWYPSPFFRQFSFVSVHVFLPSFRFYVSRTIFRQHSGSDPFFVHLFTFCFRFRPHLFSFLFPFLFFRGGWCLFLT